MTDTIDIEKWLRSNKLAEIYDAFKSHNIKIEELVHLNDNEIQIFAKNTLQLDTLASKRLIRSINKLKQNQNTNVSHKKVIISAEEHQMLTDLYQRFDECSKLQNHIQKSLVTSLTGYHTKCIDDITLIFDDIIRRINTQKHKLLQEIDMISDNKQRLLSKQLSILQKEYIPMIKHAQNEYNIYLKGNNKTLNILNMTQRILSFNNSISTITMSTKPNVIFNINNTKEIGNTFMNRFKIDDCDKPLPPKLQIMKVTANTIYIEYNIKKEYYKNIGKPIMKICIEYALIKHNEERLWNDCEENDNMNDSDSDSDIDIESMSVSEEHSSEEGDAFNTKLPTKTVEKYNKKRREKKKKKSKKVLTKTKAKITEIDASLIVRYDELKWYSVELNIDEEKRKKYDKKYKIEDNIKDNATYIFRIKSLNESGWSDYNKRIHMIKTPKMILKSKILSSNKEKMKLKTMIDKETGNKHKKWKLVYRASKDGKGEHIFRKIAHNKRNLVCLIKSADGNKFGGYTSTGWTHGPTEDYEHDGNAFVFLLKSTRRLKPAIFKVTNPSHALYNQSNYYCFFNGNDCTLYINSNGLTGYGAANNNGSDYQRYPTEYYLTNTQTFTVDNIEVFQLKK